MRIKLSALILGLSLMPAAAAQAQYFSAASAPNTDNTPFWDVTSDDGANCNIGYLLGGQTSSATCINNKISGSYSAPFNSSLSGAWYAHGFNNVNESIGFGFVGGTGTVLNYFGGIAGANPLRSLFLRNTTTGAILWEFNDVSTDLVNGGVGYGKGRSFSLTSNMFFDIGIGAHNPLSSTPNFFSWTSSKPNQFAVFGNGATYGGSADCGTSGCWVGAEDISQTSSDYDYNDGLLRISGASTVVPEPSTYALMAAGLLGMFAVSRRRRTRA